MTDFNSLIPEARAFYTNLKDNNSKAWWDENRSTYDTILKPTAQALLAELGTKLAELTGGNITTKLFRANRDVRFSKDKTPYHTHLHMMWNLAGDGPQAPVYFFGIGLDYVTVGAGMMDFQKPVLENWRKFADLDADRLLALCTRLTKDGMIIREPELKRVPAPYPADHPAEAHLRRKGFVASKDIGTPSDLSKTVFETCEELLDLNKFLIQVAEA